MPGGPINPASLGISFEFEKQSALRRRNFARRYACLMIAAAAITTGASAASANQDNWLGGPSWNDPTDWSLGVVPLGGYSVTAAASDPTSSGAVLNYDYNGPDLTLASLTIDSPNPFLPADTLLLGANSTFLNTVTENIGIAGNGSVIQNEGSNTIELALSLGGTLTSNTRSTGSYVLSGGQLAVGGGEYLGGSGTATFTQSGGVNVTSAPLILGYGFNSNGSYSLSSGNLNVNGSITTGNSNVGVLSSPISELVGNRGLGSFTQTGGANSMSSGLQIGSTSVAGGSYTLGGGSLAIGGSLEVVTGSTTFPINGLPPVVNPALTVNSGQLTVSGIAEIAGSFIGNSPTAQVVLHGGTTTVSGGLYVGGEFENAVGNLTVNGGTLNVAGLLQIGNYPNSITLAGGTINVGTLTSVAPPTPSTFNWTSGTLNFNSPLTFDGSPNNPFGNGFTLGPNQTLTSTGGATISSQGQLTQAGGTLAASSLSVMGLFSYKGGTISAPSITLNGGIINAPTFAVATNQSLTLNNGTFNIGTLNVFGNFVLPNSNIQGSVSDVVVNSGGTVSSAPFGPGTTISNGTTWNIAGGLATMTALTINSGTLLAAEKGTIITGPLNVNGPNSNVMLDGGASVNASAVDLQNGTLLAIGDATVTAKPGSFEVSSQSELQLNNSLDAVVNAGTVFNSGLINGSGKINAQLENNGGEVNIAAGQSLKIVSLSSSSINNPGGLISLTGGQLHVAGSLNNLSGAQIAGNGTLRVDNPLFNDGSISLGGLPSYLFGPIDNNGNASLALSGTAYVYSNVTNGGTIHLSGPGNTFYGTVNNEGLLTVDPGASGLLYGAYSGNGAIVNNGSLYINANSVSGPVTGSGGITIGAAGAPTSLQIIPGAGISTLSSLTINSGSQLDITNNATIINYGSAANDPVKAIRAELAAAYAAKYSGSSLAITSSIAAAKPSAFAIGYVDDTTTHQLKFALTVPGDANLSGATDFDDLTTVAQFFGQSLAKGNNVSWQTGDLNYDGSVDFGDLTIIAQYFGDSLTKAQAAELPASFVAQYDLALAEVGGTASVPEPVGVWLLAIGGMGLLGRRRRCARGGERVEG